METNDSISSQFEGLGLHGQAAAAQPPQARTTSQQRKTAAKVGHRKSRTGCVKCRARKVKCDEKTPTCNNCKRLGLDCEYTTPKPRVQAVRARKVSPESTQSQISASKSDNEVIGLSNDDQLMQLRLLHAYMSRGIGAPSDGTSTGIAWRKVWFNELPRIALQHENLLYCLMAFSATQVLGSSLASSSSGPDRDLVSARARYWTMALRSQQEAIQDMSSDSSLGRANMSTIEATSLAAILISTTVFGLLRDRVLEPYEPPMDWFEVAQGAWTVSPQFEMIDKSQSEVLQYVFLITKGIWEKRGRVPGAVIHPIYQPLLTFRVDEEMSLYGGDYMDALEAYEHALLIISSFRNAVAEEAPVYQRIQRITLFAQLVPPTFVMFLRQERPRALLVLGCFFAVAAQSKALFGFGDSQGTIPKREIEAIQGVLPPEWLATSAAFLDELIIV